MLFACGEHLRLDLALIIDDYRFTLFGLILLVLVGADIANPQRISLLQPLLGRLRGGAGLFVRRLAASAAQAGFLAQRLSGRHGLAALVGLVAGDAAHGSLAGDCAPAFAIG